MSRFIQKRPFQKVPAIPPFLRNHIWQPFKALLAAGELWLLIPITLHSPDGIRSMYTVAYGVWADVLILAVQLIFLYMLTHFFDSVDDITFADYCKSPVPLLRRYSWWLSAGLCTVGCAPSLAVGVGLVLRNTAVATLAAPLYALLVHLLAGLVVCGVRLFQIWRLNRKWSRQRLAEEGTYWPGLRTRIFQAIVLPLSLYLFVRLLLKTGYLYIIPNLIWAVLVLAGREGGAVPGILSAAVGICLLIAGIRLFRAWRARKQLLRQLNELSRSGLLSCRLVGHPFLSLLSQRILFGLFAVDARGNRWRVGVASCRRRSRSAVVCPEHLLRFRHVFRFRMAPIVNAYGAYMHQGEEMGVRYTNYPVLFPGGAFPDDLPAPVRLSRSTGRRRGDPVETEVMLLTPVPAQLFVRAPRGLVPLDNGSEVYGYQVWSSGAFCRLLERQYTGE